MKHPNRIHRRSQITVWAVRQGDTLLQIAQEVYGNPRHWREIAEANRIDHPLAFPEARDVDRLLVLP